jgi:hypothetical protein
LDLSAADRSSLAAIQGLVVAGRASAFKAPTKQKMSTMARSLDQDMAVVEQFYDAMHHLDTTALLETLTPDFVGHVSAGLPGGSGGTHRGAATMLDDVWVPVYRSLGALPWPREYLSCGDDTVVVVGEYRASAGYPSFSAEFVHILRLDGPHIAELRQITDTRSWPEVEA